MLYRISKLSFLFVLAIAFTFISCDKEGIDELTENFSETTAQNREDSNGLQGRRGQQGNRGGNGSSCFDLVYPITLSFPDGSTAAVADKEEAKAAKQAFKTDNPDAEGGATLVFPIQIDQDGTITDVADADALEVIKDACPSSGKRGGNRGNNKRGGKSGNCYSTVFPLTLEFPDGSSTEVLDRDAAKAAVEAWKEANPDVEGRSSIAFPYDVLLQDSSVVTLTSQEELDALKESCGGDRGSRGNRGNRGNRGEKCYQVNLPLSITINGGEAIIVNEQADKRTALAAWKEANPDATERPDIALVFPITVTLEDGTESMVNNQEELDALKATCTTEEEGQ